MVPNFGRLLKKRLAFIITKTYPFSPQLFHVHFTSSPPPVRHIPSYKDRLSHIFLHSDKITKNILEIGGDRSVVFFGLSRNYLEILRVSFKTSLTSRTPVLKC